MTTLRNTVILASAGTGKTFALSGHYLKLLLAGCGPERILATTFTRKAAGEILDRVLLRLAQAALDPDRCHQLARECDHPSLTPTQCRSTLAQLVRHSDQINIGTLDAFFAKVALAFRFDSGRSAGRIATESEDADIRDRSLLAALEYLPPERLLQTMLLLSRGALKAPVIEPLRRRAEELRNVHANAREEAWHAISSPGTPLTLGAIASTITRLAQVAVPLTKKGQPNSRWRTAIDKSISAARSSDWASLLTGGLGGAIACEANEYHGAPIGPDLLAALTLLVDHARHELLTQLREDTLATREFMSCFASHYEGIKQREGIATFDDIPRALQAADACGDLEHLYFRLDTQIDHLLVDEFQDTSAVQYQLLSRLIEEIVQDSEGRRSFFAVGDVKQSLYQWRDATPSLLLALPSRVPNVVQRHLDKNYRSSTAVLEAVNRVFGSLPGSTILNETPAGIAASELWDRTFRPHTGLDQFAGFVRLRTAPPLQGNNDPQTARLAAAADHAAEITRLNPFGSVGILLQTRKQIAPMVAALGERGVAASREGGNTLTDSPAVALALSAVRLAEHPGDSAAFFHLSHSALTDHLRLTPPHNLPARQAASDLRACFSRIGYARTLTTFLESLLSRCTPIEIARFEQLIDLAREYDAAPTPTLAGFEKLVRSTRVQSPSDARVRVMTVHGSKGLEFDSVILPDLDDTLSGNSRDLFAVERDPDTHEISAVFRQSQLGPLLHPRLAAMSLEAKTKHLHERLCVLYVAMTRARLTLDMIVGVHAPPKKPAPAGGPTYQRSFAGLLRESLAPNAPLIPATTLFQEGELSASLRMARPEFPPASRSKARPIRLRPSASLRLSALPRRSPSLAVQREAISAAPNRSDSIASLRGKVFHAWCEDIEWLELAELSDDRYREVAAGVLRRSRGQQTDLNSQPITQWIADFSSALAKPGLAQALSRQSTAHRMNSSELTAHREHRFSVRDTDLATNENSLLVGQLDRLVIARRASLICAAEILDFKTDAMTADARLTSHSPTVLHNPPQPHLDIASRYKPQLDAYRRAVASMLRLSLSQVRASIFLIASDTRVDIE